MDIGGIEVIGTGSRLLTAEDVTEVTKHIEQLESENAKLHELIVQCCDCESAREHYEGMDVWWCEHLQRYVGSDGFCCWGIRRDYEEGK